MSGGSTARLGTAAFTLTNCELASDDMDVYGSDCEISEEDSPEPDDDDDAYDADSGRSCASICHHTAPLP